MCCCASPNVNGTPDAYSWDGKNVGTRPIDAPTPEPNDSVLFDEPGRCGGLDSHCHHFTVVKARFGGFALLVRHGGGDERIDLGHRHPLINVLGILDSTARYWLLLEVYNIAKDSARKARGLEAHHWQTAAAEKRIKTRKQPGRDAVKVWIEPK